MNGEHDVGRDDGGIHIGKVASVVLPYPCVLVLSADDKKDTRAEGIARRLRSFVRASGLSTAQILNGCLLTAVGARRAASKMRSKASCGISLSERERQEKRSRMSSLNSITLPPLC